MKTCKVCNQLKPFDPAIKGQSKAAGFMGKVCWDCYVRASRLKSRGLDPNDLAKDAELEAQRALRLAHTKQAAEARAERALRKLSPEYVAAQLAKIALDDKLQELRYLEWTERQKRKNEAKLFAHDRLQEKAKSYLLSSSKLKKAKSDND